MKQNTKEWYEWRAQGIGSSDVPIILGASKFKTALELYNEKVGICEPDDYDKKWAALKGSALEGAARNWYKAQSGAYDCAPCCVVHPKNPVFRASLDGFSESKNRLVEIKCLGDSENHKNAAKGIVPKEYYIQMQYQMLVTGTPKADYFSFNGHDGTVIEVDADPTEQQRIIHAVLEFWDRLQKKDPPPYSPQDYKPITDPGLLGLVDDFCAMRKLEQQISGEVKALRKKIEEKLDHPRHIAPGIKIWQTTRQGPVQLHMIPELQGVDVDQYRTKSSTSYVFKPASEGSSKDG